MKPRNRARGAIAAATLVGSTVEKYAHHSRGSLPRALRRVVFMKLRDNDGALGVFPRRAYTRAREFLPRERVQRNRDNPVRAGISIALIR